jgi:hypothetical protein
MGWASQHGEAAVGTIKRFRGGEGTSGCAQGSRHQCAALARRELKRGAKEQRKNKYEAAQAVSCRDTCRLRGLKRLWRCMGCLPEPRAGKAGVECEPRALLHAIVLASQAPQAHGPRRRLLLSGRWVRLPLDAPQATPLAAAGKLPAAQLLHAAAAHAGRVPLPPAPVGAAARWSPGRQPGASRWAPAPPQAAERGRRRCRRSAGRSSGAAPPAVLSVMEVKGAANNACCRLPQLAEISIRGKGLGSAPHLHSHLPSPPTWIMKAVRRATSAQEGRMWGSWCQHLVMRRRSGSGQSGSIHGRSPLMATWQCCVCVGGVSGCMCVCVFGGEGSRGKGGGGEPVEGGGRKGV